MPNKELFNKRQRTKQGVRNAKESGRYLGRAPYGYNNIIDGTKKNLIEINSEQAKVQFLIEKAKAMMAEPMKLKKEKHQRAI